MNRNLSLETWPLAVVVVAAAAAPSLLAFNVSPSPTFLNQALALGLWGAFAFLLGQDRGTAGGVGQALLRSSTLLGALVLLVCAAAWSGLATGLPSSLVLSAVGLLAAAGVLVVAGAASATSVRGTDVFFLFCLGWIAAGVFNTGIAAVQVFAPAWTDGDLLAHSSLPGRAVGNLRQPNHLSSLLLWSAIAVAACSEAGRLARPLAALLMVAFVFAVVLTASRTGLVGVALLALWGLTDRRLTRSTRWLLVAAPVLYAVSWVFMAAWADAAASTFGGQQRLSEGDLSASRFGIWSNTMSLIRMNPWAGVGFGEFNFAWSLTPFPGRPGAFFDHTHNLPLQLAVELGLPLACAVLALLLFALWQSWRYACAASGEIGLAGRSSLAMLVMIGLHSLLEYPLWYSYFLLPAAWAWGFVLGLPSRSAAPVAGVGGGGTAITTSVAGALVALGAAASVADYSRVAVIFSSAPGALPLEQRIVNGQRSIFFAHHAHYAAATVADDPATALESLGVASHYLLDTRLMMAWSRALANLGDIDRARFLAARLREFKNPLSADFLAQCLTVDPAVSNLPYQCTPASHDLGWRDFIRP